MNVFSIRRKQLKSSAENKKVCELIEKLQWFPKLIHTFIQDEFGVSVRFDIF